MVRRKNFEQLSRAEQRTNLLGRLHRVRCEMEQYLRDLDYWNSLQRARGGETLPRDDEVIRQLADIDQQIQQIRNSR